MDSNSHFDGAQHLVDFDLLRHHAERDDAGRVAARRGATRRRLARQLRSVAERLDS